jgi:hypothetical protein
VEEPSGREPERVCQKVRVSGVTCLLVASSPVVGIDWLHLWLHLEPTIAVPAARGTLSGSFGATRASRRSDLLTCG